MQLTCKVFFYDLKYIFLGKTVEEEAAAEVKVAGRTVDPAKENGVENNVGAGHVTNDGRRRTEGLRRIGVQDHDLKNVADQRIDPDHTAKEMARVVAETENGPVLKNDHLHLHLLNFHFLKREDHLLGSVITEGLHLLRNSVPKKGTLEQCLLCNYLSVYVLEIWKISSVLWVKCETSG